MELKARRFARAFGGFPFAIDSNLDMEYKP